LRQAERRVSSFIASGIGILFVGMCIALFITRVYIVRIYITLTICVFYIHLAGDNICLGTAESCFECDALRQLRLLPQTRHHPNADLQLSLRLVPRRRFDPNAGEERRALRKSVGSVA
jgi:hypothetical protein